MKKIIIIVADMGDYNGSEEEINQKKRFKITKKIFYYRYKK